MSADTLTELAIGDEYELRSDADGAAFILRFKTDCMTAHIKDEDAARFRADYETIKAQYPDWKADQMLAQLWDQGGYSWLAVLDEDR